MHEYSNVSSISHFNSRTLCSNSKFVQQFQIAHYVSHRYEYWYRVPLMIWSYEFVLNNMTCQPHRTVLTANLSQLYILIDLI